MRFVDVLSLIPEEQRNQYNWGGMSLSYTEVFMEAWAQLTLYGVGGRNSVDVLFNVVDAPRSNVREAVWRMPFNGAAAIAMGNYSNTPAPVTLTFSNGETQQFTVAPFATKIITRQSIQSQSEAESVKITSSGQTGRLITTGAMTTTDGNFTSSIRFYDTQNIVQSNLYATNFRLKNSTPYIVLKNTTASAITAQPRFLPTAGEGSGVVQLSPVTIPANGLKKLNLTPLMNAAATRQDLNSVVVQIINSGTAGSLIGAANTTNNSNGITYDIPLRDSGPMRNSTGGYPVRLDADYTTVLSITNVGSNTAWFTMQINYNGGPYAVEPQQLAPGATKIFDVRKLRDEQTPDNTGVKLPLNLTVGQIRWSAIGEPSTKLIGRSEVISASGKVSSSYSCNTCCKNSPESAWSDPGIYYGYLTDMKQFTAMERDHDCYGNLVPPYAVNRFGNVNWTSYDNAVASVNSFSGMVTANGIGDTLIEGTWEATRWQENLTGTDCELIPEPMTATGEMVVRPKITSITPARGGVGSTTRVTINGVGFLDAPIVNAGSGIVISIVSFSRTQIVADFAIASNATGGDRNVTVSGSGITSNAVNFFVQIPTSLSVLSVTVIPTPSIYNPIISTCSPGNDYGISVSIRYQINDQGNPSYPISNTVMIPEETVTNFYINGVQQPDLFPDWEEFSTPSGPNEQFLDVPLGFCAPQAYNSASYVQNIRLLIQGTQTTYHIRTNNFVFTLPASGQGSITNGSDIQKSRP